MQRGLLILLYTLAIVVAFIAGRVEYLNAAAGYRLPRGPDDLGKWRASSLNEERWRQFHGPRDESGTLVVRDLTANERRQMESEIAREDANGRLRDWVRSAGLLQYLLLPALVFFTLVIVATKPTRRQIVAIAPVIVVIIYASMSLLYRSYYFSLGL